MKTDADTNRLIQAAMEYAGYGWRVLPIKPASKLPLIKAWQQAATADEGQIAAWWEKWPTANVGVCLGEGSGIVDLECDSEKAEQEFLALFDGESPVTTTYQGQRGKHRLFRWRGDLPGGAVTKLGDIEVRTGNGGKGAQSVFPPSIHPSGVAYQWLVPPSEFPPAALPDAILARLWNLAGDDLTPPAGGGLEHTAAQRAALYVDTIEGCAEGNRNQRGYRVACTLLKDFALSTDDAWPILGSWNVRNGPPLPEIELRRLLNSAGKYGLGVVGSKLDGQAPAKRKPKAWEPKTPEPTNTELTDDFTVPKAPERDQDISAFCCRLIQNAKELARPAGVTEIFRAIEAVNMHREHPLSENELKAVFTMHLKAERGKRMAQQAEAILNPTPEAVADGATTNGRMKAPGVWKLVIVHSDPPRYELHSPLFRKAPCITLDAKQMNSAGMIRVEALQQAECALPKAFDKLWSDPGGLYETVIHTAEHRDAMADDKRKVVIAEKLLEALTHPVGIGKPQTIEEGGEPDSRGRPCLMPSGEIVCKFTHLWEPMRRSEDRVERSELSAVLQGIGALYQGIRATGRVSRFLVVSPEAQMVLRKICDAE